MKTRYRHTCLVARDWRSLARFYETVFGCVPVPPQRDLAGGWLERGTGVPRARLAGIHLRLPGTGPEGPTLEIFQYARSEPKPQPAANRQGFGHIAFEVEDVPAALSLVRLHGGGAVGEVTRRQVAGVGSLTFVYATDPEGNLVELQSWE